MLNMKIWKWFKTLDRWPRLQNAQSICHSCQHHTVNAVNFTTKTKSIHIICSLFCWRMLCLCAPENSCKGRCGEAFKRGRLCSCDTDCQKYKQCCPDYKLSCNTEGKLVSPPSALCVVIYHHDFLRSVRSLVLIGARAWLHVKIDPRLSLTCKN